MSCIECGSEDRASEAARRLGEVGAKGSHERFDRFRRSLLVDVLQGVDTDQTDDDAPQAATKARNVLEGPTFQGTGAKHLAIYTPLTLLEKMGSLEGAVLIEFPDVVTAKAWYDSPSYEEVRELRIGAADVEIFIIDGGALPIEDRMPQTRNPQG